MFIPYEYISKKLSLFLPERFRQKVLDLGYKLKIKRNLRYIKHNQTIVRKKLKNKKTLNVAFYVYDSTKWKCQSLYNLLDKDERFNVTVLVTKNNAKNIDNPSYQTADDVVKTYEFFKRKNMYVKYAYDTNKSKFIPFEQFNPDVIIYQHPWYVETSQGPVVCSKFALTCYVPYYFPTTTAPIDYYLRFHQYVERYYIFDKITQNVYIEKMENKGINLKVTGQPFLDYYRLNQQEEKEYVIYAPHWTICGKGISYGTFEWNGKFMLKYAKQHPEKKLVFKPHPMLFKALIDNNVMTRDEAESYYQEWDKVGLKYESGDYLDLFNKSALMITDCSSFLGEFFMTASPVIHLISESATPFNETVNQVIKNYYKAHNVSELEDMLNTLPDKDTMKEQRLKAVKDLGFKDNYAAQNIVDDIIEVIG